MTNITSSFSSSQQLYWASYYQVKPITASSVIWKIENWGERIEKPVGLRPCIAIYSRYTVTITKFPWWREDENDQRTFIIQFPIKSDDHSFNWQVLANPHYIINNSLSENRCVSCNIFQEWAYSNTPLEFSRKRGFRVILASKPSFSAPSPGSHSRREISILLYPSLGWDWYEPTASKKYQYINHPEHLNQMWSTSNLNYKFSSTFRIYDFIFTILYVYNFEMLLYMNSCYTL